MRRRNHTTEAQRGGATPGRVGQHGAAGTLAQNSFAVYRRPRALL